MAFTIPNQADAGTSSQSEVDAVDFGILVAAYNGTGVVTGGVVAQQSSADMTVQVAAGTVLINGLHYTISAGNGTITTADSSNPRFDLITINTSGAIVVTAGTAASNPVFPAIPADDAVLAAVHVPAGDTAIATAQITDKRVIVASPGVPDNAIFWLGTTGDTAMVHSTGALSADATLANVIEGSPDHVGTAVNSLLVSNITDDGDIMFLVSDGGNSKGLLKLDGANGRVVIHGGDLVMSGAQKIYFFDVGGEYMSSDGSTLTITGAVALTPTVGATAWNAAQHTHAGATTGGTVAATSATVASTVVVVDTTDSSTSVALFDDATGSLAIKTDGGLTYDASSGMLTATGLTGPLTGNASGTAATVTGGTQAAITSAANLVTVGTIGTGIWRGTTVEVDQGGTGLASYAVGDIVYASGTTTLAKLTKGSEDEVLTMGGSNAPTWAAASAGAVTREGGDTSEATTQSTSTAEAAAVTSVSIAVTDPIKLILSHRKTGTHASRTRVGATLNDNTEANRLCNSATAQAETGTFTEYWCGRSTNHIANIYAIYGSTVASNGDAALAYAVDGGIGRVQPTATVTSINVDHLVINTDNLHGTNEVQVYSSAGS